MPGLTITYAETGSKGCYTASLKGMAESAELTLSKVSDTLIIVDHTMVPDPMRGNGIAAALAQRAIADARAAGQRIIPLCPFFRGYAARHREETADVIQW